MAPPGYTAYGWRKLSLSDKKRVIKPICREQNKKIKKIRYQRRDTGTRVQYYRCVKKPMRQYSQAQLESISIDQLEKHQHDLYNSGHGGSSYYDNVVDTMIRRMDDQAFTTVRQRYGSEAPARSDVLYSTYVAAQGRR